MTKADSQDQKLVDEMKGQKLTEVRFVHDYVQLVFEAGQCFTINNDYTASADNIATLIPLTLMNITDCPNCFCFQFEHGETLTVDMRDSAWNSPEAMTLSVPLPDGLSGLVVWN